MFKVNEQLILLNMLTRETEILDQAIGAFQKETNLAVRKGSIQPQRHEDTGIDATMKIDLPEKTAEYWVQIKATLTNTTIAQLAHQFENEPGKWLLVTRYVHPLLAKTMRELHVQFMDTVGNAYINTPPALIVIQANKRQPNIFEAREEGMLGQAGLKVVFAFLCRRDLCNATYREIAKQAPVALGTVARVMKDLTAQGYLVKTDEKQQRLIRKKELLNKWLTAYAEKLRPKRLIGRYKATRPNFWQQEDIDRVDAQWGGEVAAYRLTRYLKPEIVTIYTRKPVNNLMLDVKLRQDKNGDVELRERFWTFDPTEPDKAVVPPLLVYADLMATGDPRNIEAAKIVYDDYLQRYIEQN